MENITDILCDFAYALKLSDLPDKTIVQIKKYITDYFAASLAGIRVNKTFNTSILNVIKKNGGNPQASILLERDKVSMLDAAFINAAYAHGADLDDGNRVSAGHIGTHVISAVFALAEARNLFWKDVIVAINVGYEFFNRIGGAAQPSLYNKGFHSTGVVGAIAAAAACAKLLGLDKTEIYTSVSIAAVQAGGLIIIDESGQGCKPINPANAARIGLLSALLAEQKIEAPVNPLESKKGWFHAFSDNVQTDKIMDGLGKEFTIDQSYLKLYPTCRHTHSCIDAISNIRKELCMKDKYQISMIEKIKVFTYPSAIKSAGAIVYPKNIEEAKFSIPFAIAVALTKGHFTIADLSLYKTNSDIKFLAESVELIADETMENRAKGIRGAKIQVYLSNGKVYENTILVPKGEGKDSLTWENIKQKIHSCSESLVKKECTTNLFEFCKAIEVDKLYSYPALLLLKEDCE